MSESGPKRIRTKLAAASATGAKLPVLEQHAEAIARGADCTACPLYGGGEGPVVGDIVPGAALAVVAESPGVQDVEQGFVLAGKSGGVVDNCLSQGGYDRDSATVTYAVACRPPIDLQTHALHLRRDHKLKAERAKAENGGKKVKLPPPRLPVDACYPRLKWELEKTGAKVLVGLGQEGLRAVAQFTGTPYGNVKVDPGTPKVALLKKQQGAPVPLKDGRILLGTYHPAFAQRRGARHFLPTIEQDLVRACDIARRGRIEWVEPKVVLNPSEDEAVNYVDMLRESGQRIMDDIETDSLNLFKARIRVVGMGAVIDGEERAIVVPFRHTDGRQWFGDAARIRLGKAVRRLHDEAPLGFFNGVYDTAVLLLRGLMTNRRKTWWDGTVAHHDTDHSEFQHDLGFIISRFFEAPRHKGDADHKGTGEGSDRILHEYNAADVITQLRLMKPLSQRVVECDMMEAFRTDTGLLPHARDMGLLGIKVDEEKRHRFYAQLKIETDKEREKIQKVTGIPDFNPNSFRQVAKFLYIEKGLSPPADPEAQRAEAQADYIHVPGTMNPWEDEDEDEGSIEGLPTNEATLMYLLDQGVDKQTEAFIEAQLDYRSVAKLKGTYLGLRNDPDTGKLIDTFRERGYIIDHADRGGMPFFHASWKLHTVPGGRWASSPNAQNWPEMGLVNIREMYEAVPGHVFAGGDFSQIENRLYAVQSGDKVLLEAYARGMDVHSLNFATMMAPPGDVKAIAYWYDRTYNAEKYDPIHGKAIKKAARKKAKIFCYLLTYGGMEDKLYKAMSIMRDPDGKRSFPDLKPSDIRLWWRNYRAAHPWLERWQHGVVNAWKDAGYIASILDERKCYFLGGVDNTAMANFSIQPSASSILNRGARKVFDACPFGGWSPLSGPIGNYHDSIVLQVPEARQKEAEELMATHMPYELRGMKFDFEIKSGRRLNEV